MDDIGDDVSRWPNEMVLGVILLSLLLALSVWDLKGRLQGPTQCALGRSSTQAIVPARTTRSSRSTGTPAQTATGSDDKAS